MSERLLLAGEIVFVPRPHARPDFSSPVSSERSSPMIFREGIVNTLVVSHSVARMRICRRRGAVQAAPRFSGGFRGLESEVFQVRSSVIHSFPIFRG